MSIPRGVAILLLIQVVGLLVVGCRELAVEPSGKLACSRGTHECPNGYQCGSDTRCWRIGEPSDGSRVDGDSSLDGPTVDGGMGTDGDGGQPVGVCSPGATRSCDRDGALGRCGTGSEPCVGGRWGTCSILPLAADRCDIAGDDSNCNGTANEGCACANGSNQPCGPSASQGICRRGTQTCTDGGWGVCTGAVFGKARDCTSALDNDCDGKPDNTTDAVCQCTPGAAPRSCGAHAEDGIGACHAGSQTCVAGPENAASAWSDCVGAVGPAANDACTAGDDSNCNGVPNDGCAATLVLTVKAGSSANFGTVPIGSTVTETFIVTNTGSKTSTEIAFHLNGSGYSIKGTDAGDCVDGVTVLSPAAMCAIQVALTPTGGGTYAGSLSVSARIGGLSDTLNLMATAPAKCGDGKVMAPEECDLGTAMNTGSYGGCTSTCTRGPFCGDGKVNGAEVCDNGSNNAMALNACNPECSGIIGIKVLKVTPAVPATFGGVKGADTLCQSNFGASYKAVLADGTTRIANDSPSHIATGEGQKDWPIKKYTLYRNGGDQDVFMTDGTTLLGLHKGIYVALTNSIYGYANDSLNAWSGTDYDWTNTGHDCQSYTQADSLQSSGWISLYATEHTQFPNGGGWITCSSQQHIVCAQQ